MRVWWNGLCLLLQKRSVRACFFRRTAIAGSGCGVAEWRALFATVRFDRKCFVLQWLYRIAIIALTTGLEKNPNERLRAQRDFLNRCEPTWLEAWFIPMSSQPTAWQVWTYSIQESKLELKFQQCRTCKLWVVAFFLGRFAWHSSILRVSLDSHVLPPVVHACCWFMTFSLSRQTDSFAREARGWSWRLSQRCGLSRRTGVCCSYSTSCAIVCWQLPDNFC